MAILDLGCGTGLLCNAYAEDGHRVTGCDPAQAMLDVARSTRHGATITWVRSTSQAFRSEDRYDLIIMTGHAFQVLLEADDAIATLRTAYRHLAPGGRFVFESGNPAQDWATKRHGTIASYSWNGSPFEVKTSVVSAGTQTLVFEQRYVFPDAVMVSRSELRFPALPEVRNWLTIAGLTLEALYGGWQHRPFDPASAEEMVFVTRAAPLR